MQPYSTPYYFVILGLALLPLIIALLNGKKLMWYQVLISIGFLAWSFAGSITVWALLGYGVYQTLLVKAYEYYRIQQQKNNTLTFYLAVLLAILPLTVVKVTPVINPAHPSSIIGFLGISYLTFKVVNVVIELRDDLIHKVPLRQFIYFLYFFPTISSGPIDRFRRFEKEYQKPTVDNYEDLLGKGILRIFLGFLYKFIIGHLIVTYFLHQVAIDATVNPNFINMLGAMYGYGLYLFFDFAGYSFFAIGLSNLMGYDMPINFNKPFISKNIKDFWNRWHMTLSFWFRDFVYMRLVKTIMVNRWSKNRVFISNVSYVALFGLMGLWHGLTWYYIAYGLYHAGLMIGYDAWLRFKKHHHIKIPSNIWTNSLSIFITFNAVFIGFLLFSGIPNDAIMHYFDGHSPLPNI